MEIIYLLVTSFTKKLPDIVYKDYISVLPVELQEKNSHFVRWHDRHSDLLGKLLLIEGFKLLGYSKNEISNLKYNKYNRPFLNKEIDFNISHSGKYIICAIGKDLKIGVDIEEIKEIEFNDFNNVMTDEQWGYIHQSVYPMESFFKYWTIKESVIKADSRGLSVPLLDIIIEKNSVHYDNRTWYLNEICIDRNYCSCLATNKKEVNIKMIEMNFHSGIVEKRTFITPKTQL